MAGYRRLISYIYAYEGEEKGKNIGFAKLEARNGQCRLSINVKKIYAGGNDMGVYLLSSGQEIFLGNIFIRNGSGDFRTCVNVENVMGTGCSMDSCIGLVIHEKGEDWRNYKTVWEDAVAQAAELEFAEVTSEKRGDPDELLKKHIEELNQEIDQAAEEAARELEKQTLVQETEVQELEVQEAEAQEAETQDVETRETIEAPVPPVNEQENCDMEHAPSAQISNLQNAVSASTARGANPQNAAPASPTRAPDPQNTSPAPAPRPQTGPKTSQAEEIPLGNQEELERLDQEEERWGPDELWNRFRKHYPKMQAFDSPGTVEILSIRPQDIGLLPRENWRYGNNSFLLHGYYNYRYLIFARVGDEKHTRPRYILGVPGHYYSNEKYMASMFGFPHFVLAKTQPAQDGRFGYWYADVRMENAE